MESVSNQHVHGFQDHPTSKQTSTTENRSSSVLKDIVRLQMHSLKSKVVTAQAQITGITPIFAINTAEPKDGLVPSLEQVQVIQPQDKKEAEIVEALPNETSDFVDILNEANGCSIDPQDTTNLNKTIDTAKEASEVIEKKSKTISLERQSFAVSPSKVLIELKEFDRLRQRFLVEANIFKELNARAQAIDSSLVLHRIGSVFYKIIRKKSDFNMMVTIKKSTSFFSFGRKTTPEPSAIFELIKEDLNRIGSQFHDAIKWPATRVNKEHLRMIHKGSGIRCTLHIESPELAKSADILSQIIQHKPLGKLVFNSFVPITIMIILIKLVSNFYSSWPVDCIDSSVAE